MVDAVLIELEGVLFDTRAARLGSMRGALKRAGVSVTRDPDVSGNEPLRAVVSGVLSNAGMTVDDVLIDLIVHDAEGAFTASIAAKGVSLSAGAAAFLEGAAAHARLAVVTRMNRSAAESLLRLASFDRFITAVVTSDDVLDGKPAVAAYTGAMERLRRGRALDAANVIALEDSAPGIRAARAAGVRCVAVGFLAPHYAMEADAYVESLADHSLTTLDKLSAPGQERVQ
jgi:beta-phosphoglucomutase